MSKFFNLKSKLEKIAIQVPKNEEIRKLGINKNLKINMKVNRKF